MQLWAYEKLAEIGVDGVVSDGLSLAWHCDNPGHPYGCGRIREVHWDEDLRSRVTEQRRFLKRLRGIFNETGRPFYFVAHCGGGMDINTISFFDGFMEGEQLVRYRPGYMMPSHVYAVGYNGRPWGLRTQFWDKTWRRLRGINWSLTYALLFDNAIGETFLANDILKDYEDDATTRFFPYWRNGSHVSCNASKSVTSYYLKADKALVVVSNLGFEKDTFELDLSNLFPGHSLNIEDIISGRKIFLKDRICQGKLEGYHCLALQIDTKKDDKPERNKAIENPAKVKSFVKIKGHNDSDWYNTDNESTVVCESGIKLTSELTGLSLKSNGNGALASVLLKDNQFGQDCTIAMYIKIKNRFRLRLGPLALVHDSSWRIGYESDGDEVVDQAGVRTGIVDPLLDGWNTGNVYQVPVKSDKISLLVVSVKAGVVNAVYDGHPLVKNMNYHIPEVGNTLRIETWAGDDIAFSVKEISSEASTLFDDTQVCHPIL